jgi:hypothetical protein
MGGSGAYQTSGRADRSAAVGSGVWVGEFVAVGIAEAAVAAPVGIGVAAPGVVGPVVEGGTAGEGCSTGLRHPPLNATSSAAIPRRLATEPVGMSGMMRASARPRHFAVAVNAPETEAY